MLGRDREPVVIWSPTLILVTVVHPIICLIFIYIYMIFIFKGILMNIKNLLVLFIKEKEEVQAMDLLLLKMKKMLTRYIYGLTYYLTMLFLSFAVIVAVVIIIIIIVALVFIIIINSCC